MFTVSLFTIYKRWKQTKWGNGKLLFNVYGGLFRGNGKRSVDEKYLKMDGGSSRAM